MNTNHKSAARITSETKLHYIAMAGLNGYMPSYCEVYASKESAIDSLIDLHNLSDSDLIAELRQHDYTNLDIDLDGNEYAAIVTCNCDNPAQHFDSPRAFDEYASDNDPDSALRVIENAIPDNDPFWEKLAEEIDVRLMEIETLNIHLYGLSKPVTVKASVSERSDRRYTFIDFARIAVSERNDANDRKHNTAPRWYQDQVIALYEKKVQPKLN